MKLAVIFENDDIIAFNKPSGLLTIPDRFNHSLPSLSKEVERTFGKLFVVHRLDRDTSGLIIFAKNETAHKHYSLQFQQRLVGKTYAAFTFGTPTKIEDDITLPIMEHPTIRGKMVTNRKGKASHSRYKVIQTWHGYSLMEVDIFTGRTHQIRVHLSSMNTPIIGDDLYGNGEFLYLSNFKKHYKASEKYEQENPLIGRLALHSMRLIIKDINGNELIIEAPFPKDFNAAIKQLDRWMK